jgi:hypothetical protein
VAERRAGELPTASSGGRISRAATSPKVLPRRAGGRANHARIGRQPHGADPAGSASTSLTLLLISNLCGW